MIAIRATHAFDGVDVLPDGATILIDGERIVGVEPRQFEPPSGTEIIECGGTVLPGLVNAHLHLCGDSRDGALERLPELPPEQIEVAIERALAIQLASGVTTVRDLGDPAWAVVDRRDHALATEPHIVASGPPITSVGGHCWMMGGEVAGVDALRAAVRERAERQVDVVKIMTSGGNATPSTDIAACQFTLEELRAVVDESHGLGLPVTAHAHALAAVEQAIDAGVDGIEHCTCVTADGVDFSPALWARLIEAGIVVCPTLGRDPDVSPPPRVLELLARWGLSFEERYASVAAAHAAGVRLISGDDGGITSGKRHGVFAEALLALHSGGVSVSDALASGTSVAADGCGVGDRKGRLRAGYDADILIVEGDATTDVTALRSVATVLVRGAPAVPV